MSADIGQRKTNYLGSSSYLPKISSQNNLAQSIFMKKIIVKVNLNNNSYPIIIGKNLLNNTGAEIKKIIPNHKKKKTLKSDKMLSNLQNLQNCFKSLKSKENVVILKKYIKMLWNV